LVLLQHRLLDLGNQSLISEVDALDLDLGRLLVEEVVKFFFGELAYRLVRIEKTRLDEDPRCPPAVHLVAGDGDRALGERLRVVEELSEVDIGNRASAFTPHAHAAGDLEAAPLLNGLPAALERDRPRSADRGDVEGECL